MVSGGPGDWRRLAALGAPLVVAGLVVANAWSGLMPGVGFWDTGEFQTVLPILGTAHPTGYPTYVLLGFVANILLTPLGEPAFRITVLSLLAVAVAAGATVVLVRSLSGSTIVGMAAGLGLATTPVVWVNETRADPHPIHLMFVALLLLALVWWEHGRRDLVAAHQDPRRADRRLLAAAVVFGLAAGNHSLTLLFAPAIAIYVLAVEPGILRRLRFVGACLGLAALTIVLVYLELPIRGGLLPAALVYGRPATWDGFWYVALAEQFRGSLGDVLGNLPGKFDQLVALTNTQFGYLAPFIPAAVIVAAKAAPRFTLLTGLALVITLLFNAAYTNADIERYYLGPVLIAWIWLGILAGEIAAFVSSLALGLEPRTGQAPSGSGASAMGTEPPTERHSPGVSAPDRAPDWTAAILATVLAVVLLGPALSDLDARRHEADRSADTGAQQWLDATLPRLAPNAVVVSWWSTSTPLWYAQDVLGLRPDLFIVDDRTMLDLDLGRAPDVINRYLGQRPVYAIRLAGSDTNELERQFDMEPVAGDGSTTVYRVNGRRSAAR